MQHTEPSADTSSFFYVYRLQSLRDSTIGYTGVTTNLKRRLQEHNRGDNTSTAAFRPFRIHFAAAFPDRKRALAFEGYLKTGSGSAFAKKRLW